MLFVLRNDIYMLVPVGLLGMQREPSQTEAVHFILQGRQRFVPVRERERETSRNPSSSLYILAKELLSVQEVGRSNGV